MSAEITSPLPRHADGELNQVWGRFLDAALRDWDRFVSWPVDEFPHVFEGGRWQRLGIGTRSRWETPEVYDHGNWTAGFSLGIAALLYAAGRCDRERLATSFKAKLDHLPARAHDLGTHDLGFLFFPSFAVGAAAGLVRPPDAAPALAAARTLGRRFNALGAYVQAFGAIGDERSAGTSTIDTMMNLPLLWWAARKFERPELHEIARRHAITAARVFVRDDGSTYQLARYDPLTGSLVARGTYQGSGAGSCWSRGQAWAVSGFAWAFSMSGERELLDAAERSAAYFWSQLPKSGVPPWDFSDTSPDATSDASAAAIAALGILLLASTHPDETRRPALRDQAVSILSRLGAACLNDDPDAEGILLHSCYSKPHGLGVNGATAWGDFYFGLALALASGGTELTVSDLLRPHR